MSFFNFFKQFAVEQLILSMFCVTLIVIFNILFMYCSMFVIDVDIHSASKIPSISLVVLHITVELHHLSFRGDQ